MDGVLRHARPQYKYRRPRHPARLRLFAPIFYFPSSNLAEDNFIAYLPYYSPQTAPSHPSKYT